MRFFRKLRKDVLTNNKIGKYLAYAIGEIMLVVIGILIALAVNNFSNQKQKEQQTKRTAQNVLRQIALDTTEISNVFKNWGVVQEQLEIVLSKSNVTKSTTPCDYCPNLILNASLPNLGDDVIRLIEADDPVDSELGFRLREISKRYKGLVQAVLIFDKITTDALTENLKYLQNNKVWFANLISNERCDDECQEYFNSSSDFKNRSAYMDIVLYKAYSRELQDFKEKIRKEMVLLTELLEE
ncbi:hypothetical protein ABN763_02945 [Spongiivirga sp. MCCC 1A20706]|uniref:hypothetical protein n=1 Tax=Spongiivirga sp. MCCC 1A20706 TaxID=3160963 RepID=UPI0039778F2A